MPERGRSNGLSWALGLLLLAVLIVLPHLVSHSQQEILVLLVINVLLVSSYRLLTLTGEWSLAHVVIMGVGAYGSALVSKELDVPVPLAMLSGASLAGLIAYLLSFPLFRMKGFYFLIGSFAAGEIIRLIWKWSEMTWLFGGPQGHQAYSARSQYRGPRDRFLRSGALLLSLPRRRGDCARRSLPGRALAHRADLPRDTLAGQTRRIRRGEHPHLSDVGLRDSVVLRRARRRALCSLCRHGQSRTGSASRRWSMF